MNTLIILPVALTAAVVLIIVIGAFLAKPYEPKKKKREVTTLYMDSTGVREIL